MTEEDLFIINELVLLAERTLGISSHEKNVVAQAKRILKDHEYLCD